MYNVFQYWMMLRNETMEPHKNSKGEFFSMQQMRCAIESIIQDRSWNFTGLLSFCFKQKSEK